ncbi:hypothetical protein LZ31DRAFT_558555 [Colletotrichum somersetense]|nr:hypothetical protein LZ31DRAFT_558555 [Colletotrichum somersetense]
MAKVSQGKRRKTLKTNRNHHAEILTRRVRRGLYDIPLEILLIIASGLPAVSRTALAPACKGFLKSICTDGRFPRMKRAEAIELVLLLERDAISRGHTDVLPCFGCASLQPFSRNDYGNWCQSTQHNPACDFVLRVINSYRYGPSFGLRPNVRSISLFGPCNQFAEARLVMDNHFFGGARGISIERLENSFQFT